MPRNSLLRRSNWPCSRTESGRTFARTNTTHGKSPRGRDDGALEKFRPDVVLFLLSSLPLAYGRESAPDRIAGRIGEMVGKVRERTRAKIVLTLPEPLADEKSAQTWAYEWRHDLLRLLGGALPVDCVQASLDPLIRRAGSRDWYSNRYYVMSKLPFHPNQTKPVAGMLAGILADIASPRLKLV